MASLVTDYGQDFLANAMFGKSVSVPTTWYIALLTQTPDASTTGSLLSEPPSAAGYARQAITNNATNFGPSSGGIVASNVAVNFGITTADWPAPITDYAFCDATTSGNVYFTGTLRVPRLVFSGDQVLINAGLLLMSVSGISQIIVGT